ncbi:hypothetical protein OEZ86_002996 [Tetradesmus obliquus]|uniref:Uncharacterized protein n=2 Tax=Tetradesmus obliquus TaxID=3088 RepID=A0ABY8TSA3_TETOB|nr:hypothetical protein OEZ85_012095 [Tetradesmus obliquus]WIA32146.1 hypothetical protein OEZ86_002996 [Tetradesmus obliquus]|eukprot:jgi/Sobl393_1/15434/SZX65854.1
MADPEAVGKAFLQYYYQLFESNRAGLANLYQEGSMLTFEGQKFQGTQAIVAKLAALPFNQAKVNPTSMDFQPSVAGGIMVFVTGSIQTEGESNALKFSQVFHLMPVGQSFVVTNDMFRLNYG